jgi:hypothetical protein
VATFYNSDQAAQLGPLFAAAPRLLAALKEALPYLEYLAENGRGNRDAERTLDMAEAAVAKAEGL